MVHNTKVREERGTFTCLKANSYLPVSQFLSSRRSRTTEKYHKLIKRVLTNSFIKTPSLVVSEGKKVRTVRVAL